MGNIKNYVVTYIPAEGSDYGLSNELKGELEKIESLVIRTGPINEQPKIIASFQGGLEDKVLEINGIVRVREERNYIL